MAILFYERRIYSTEKLVILFKVTQLVIVQLGVEVGQSDVKILNHVTDAVVTLIPYFTLYPPLTSCSMCSLHSIHFLIRIPEKRNKGGEGNK